MFGLGLWEMVVIAIVALLFVGPDKLPDAAKKISRGIRDFRKQTRELSKTINEDEELGSAVRDLKSALRGDDFRSPYVPPHIRERPGEKKLKEGDDAAEDEAASGAESDETVAGNGGVDPDLPVLKTPAGVVAKSDELTPEPEEASDPSAEADSTRDGTEPSEPSPLGTETGKVHG